MGWGGWPGEPGGIAALLLLAAITTRQALQRTNHSRFHTTVSLQAPSKVRCAACRSSASSRVPSSPRSIPRDHHLEGWDVLYNIIFCYIENILLHNRNLFVYIAFNWMLNSICSVTYATKHLLFCYIHVYITCYITYALYGCNIA